MGKPFRITLLRSPSPPPASHDVNTDLQWFCTSLGLVGNRDKNHSQFRIFIVLLKAQQGGQGISSDSIAGATTLSRATVIHHLTKLETAGIVAAEHDRYRLVVDSTRALVHSIEEEMRKSLQELEEVSKRIDERLGLNSKPPK